MALFVSTPVCAQSQPAIDSSTYHYNSIIQLTNSDAIHAAFLYFQKSSEQNLQKGDTLKAVSNLRLMAIGQNELGFVFESEKTAVKALKLLGDGIASEAVIDAKIGLYNELGMLYSNNSNYTKALELYNKALQIAQKSRDSSILLNNKANVYKHMDQFELAREQLDIVYKKSKTGKDSIQIARALNNLGYVQSLLGVPEGLTNMQTALRIWSDHEFNTGIYSGYKNLTRYYKNQENTEQAQLHADKAYATAKKINSVPYIKDALSLFMEISDDPTVVAYKRMNDSIAKAKQLQENKFALLKYDLSEEKEKTEANKLLTETQKRRTLLFQSIGVFILLSGVFLYLLLKAKHKKEKLQQVYATETRISKKVHDEVANDVYQVMTKIQGATVTSESLLDDLESIYTKTRDISKENSAVDVTENFEATLNDLLLSYQNDAVSIVTRNSSAIPWKTISEAKKTALYRVLQELMTNMRKHSEATAVAIIFQQEGTKTLVTYSDNGMGCDLKKHNGLQNAENRIHTVKGTLTFESEIGKGFKVKMTL
ncbi:Tetratricopeptide repeat-containing protein [Ulvibacter litoralis]|uniref:Tetratricopeptide repeat-containing protein n=2 Tax=Ulvibacter litoralis TaxID=227084 RepID=A0A1G7CA09_9FLAO|nr:hypothetical protein GCM10008083_09250 [Ulvibacter litoralis]SDE36147.1 Tetratricopeptide repeat-containing protein [Ulvibacter litoralis]